jgi:hypothetical protein
MNAPTLIVGLGGKGSEVALRVSKMLTDEQREKIGFAVFDTDVNELRTIKERNPFVKTIQTSTKLSVGEYLDIDTHSRDTWFPVNAILNSKTLSEGAGQVRAISRLAFETAVRSGKLEPLHQAIEDLYKLEGTEYEQALRVIIVSSLAGGTGSGILLPVALYIKNYLATRFRQSANITRGFFLLPEVFYGVIDSQSERNNLKSNAYATLRELDAFLMKGDATLPERYKNTVKMEFPVAGTEEFEEYNIRPFDFCFLFDAQNADGKKLNSFDQYLDHAANCIYSQSIGPMNKRSNSSEDNTIRRLAAERGRNRYAGAGCSMLIYPYEDVRDYIALNWTNECVSKQWLTFDKQFEKQIKADAKRRAKGIPTADHSQADSYVDNVRQMADNKNPFAKSIVEQCAVYDVKGLNRVNWKWNEYIAALEKKIDSNISQASSTLEEKENAVNSDIDALGNKDSIADKEVYLTAYRDYKEYRKMVERFAEETSGIIAYSIFRADEDEDITETQEFQIEHYFKNNNEFIHPNAIRFFLYNVLDLLKKKKEKVKADNKTSVDEFDAFEKRTESGGDEERSNDNIMSVRITKFDEVKAQFTGKGPSELEDFKDEILTNFDNAKEYKKSAVLEKVYEEAIDYVKDICVAFESFFKSFGSEIEAVNKRVSVIEKKHNSDKGLAARYVCASETCLKKMLENTPYTDGFNVIDGELSKRIYNRIREYAVNPHAKDNDQFFHGVFENGIIGFFRDSVERLYGTQVNMDIITAIEKEAEYEKKIFDAKEAEIYVKHVFDESKVLASPFIEKPLGEEREPIKACAYNNKLNPKDDSPRAILIDSQLKNFGGEEDEDIPLNRILFYKSFYGLRANDLSKFAPAKVKKLERDTDERSEGEYFKAYYELVSKVHPEAHKSKVITPHIDRWWHNVSMMPDLDDENQEKQEHNIYAAFFWAMLSQQINRLEDGNNKRPTYRLSNRLIKGMGKYGDSDNKLTVSNSTPCDNLYEVIDALSIYPALVNSILDYTNEQISKEVDSNFRLDCENINELIKSGNSADAGMLVDGLSRFEIAEYPFIVNGESVSRSVFDLPILVKKSVPTEQFFEDKVLKVLDVTLSEIKRYVMCFCNEIEAAPVIALIISKQFDKYIDFINSEKKVWPKVVNDVLFMDTCEKICNYLEELGIDAEVKKIKAKIEKIRKA